MAVFTKVSEADIEPILEDFGLGRLSRLEGIGAGIENTNYFLDTDRDGQLQRWVLTIFENLPSDELPFFSALTRHLSKHGLPVPAPVEDASGRCVFRLHYKDAVIVPCLEGQAKTDVNAADCRAAGAWLGQMHLVVSAFKQDRPLVRDLNWMRSYERQLKQSRLPRSEQSLLAHCIDRYESYREGLLRCPQGVVHGDLFRDNVLFHEGQVSGVIDFYHACKAGLLFDLAVCANDWTCDDKGQHDEEKLHSLVSAYQSVRPWTELEYQLWPRFVEVAALRFWLSRLASKYLSGYQQSSVEGETIKNPDEMRQILEVILSGDTERD